MAIKTSSDFIAEVKFSVDDPSQTRYSIAEYLVVLTDALRAIIDRASIVNPDFLQYGMGESKQVDRAVNAVLFTSTATVFADDGTAELAVDNLATTLLDNDKEWVDGEWVGYTLSITGGTGNGQSATIVSNTVSILTIDSPWAVTLDATSTYNIVTPTNKLYDNALTVPWTADQYKGAILRLTSGAGIQGQQRKISAISGHEITVESDWTVVVDANVTYEIVGVQEDYELPLDFYRLTKVKVNGVELNPRNDTGRKQVGSSVAPDVDPAYSMISNMTTQQIRIENLGAGNMIETFYIPEVGLLTTLQQIPMSDIFFRDMQYYTIMRLKGNNYEQLQVDAQFMQGADAAMIKFMTDINIESNMEMTSHYEEFVT